MGDWTDVTAHPIGYPIHAVSSHEWEFVRSAKLFCPLGIDLDCPRLARGVMVETAPVVVLWAGYETTGDGIAMDVLDLLDEFSGGEGVEVVIAGLPESATGALQWFGGFSFKNVEE